MKNIVGRRAGVPAKGHIDCVGEEVCKAEINGQILVFENALDDVYPILPQIGYRSASPTIRITSCRRSVLLGQCAAVGASTAIGLLMY